jgi:SAM-dependent methyltransferase
VNKPIFLGEPYFPIHGDNRMSNEGETAEARRQFLKERFPNLDFLLFQRYDWMNKYINVGDHVFEIGSGAGFSPLYLKVKPVLTDAINNPWIDKYIDATKMDLEDDSADVIIASHTLHHFYSPYMFFTEVLRVLKSGGILLIQEINTSLLMRVLLRAMRHEGWSYDVDVFDPKAIVNDPNDLWSANCATPWLLFHDSQKFEAVFQNDEYQLKIETNQLNECFIFPLSGGVISKTKVPRLPKGVLKMVHALDKALISVLPSVFAMGRSVVVRKIKK